MRLDIFATRARISRTQNVQFECKMTVWKSKCSRGGAGMIIGVVKSSAACVHKKYKCTDEGGKLQENSHFLTVCPEKRVRGQTLIFYGG